MTEERKFTTGFGHEIESKEELMNEIPPAIKQFMKVNDGDFSHEIHRNGAVIITPVTTVTAQDIPQNTPVDPSSPEV
jgi:hypothetical protein